MSKVAAEVSRQLAQVMHVEAEKWFRGYYMLWDDNNTDRFKFFARLEQELSDFADSLET
jgi:hypothetical protein